MSCCPNNTRAIYFQAFVTIDGYSRKCLKYFNWFGKKKISMIEKVMHSCLGPIH